MSFNHWEYHLLLLLLLHLKRSFPSRRHHFRVPYMHSIQDLPSKQRILFCGLANLIFGSQMSNIEPKHTAFCALFGGSNLADRTTFDGICLATVGTERHLSKTLTK